MTGKRFGKLVVIKRSGSDKHKNATWLCKCDCGNETIVSGIYLRQGETRSCGCLQRKVVREAKTTHGLSKTRLYRVWAGIKNRCYNPRAENYKYYGAKGVIMCDEWKNDFLSFRDWALNNGYDESAKTQVCTIDRIDCGKSYSPNNCRIANHVTQCNNQTSNRIFTYNETSKSMAEWARVFGIKYTTLRARIRRGIPFDKAIKK